MLNFETSFSRIVGVFSVVMVFALSSKFVRLFTGIFWNTKECEQWQYSLENKFSEDKKYIV